MADRLYFCDSYLRQFRARLLNQSETANGCKVVLDHTAFYPASGGQPSDTGRIEGCRVQDVVEDEAGQIVHLVDKPLFQDGELDCEVDWRRRFDHMQQHSGQHILSQAFVRTSKLNTVGFHMGSDYATIDLDMESPTKEQVRQAEDLANSIVFENRSVEVRLVPAEEVPNLSLRKESQREGPLRIVEVRDFDVSACGGTHVRMTGEVGCILITKVERVNRQARVEFVCGRRMLEFCRTHLHLLDTIARKFSVGMAETVQRVEKQLEEGRQLRKTLQEKDRQLARLLAREFYEQAPCSADFRLVRRVFDHEEPDILKLIAQSLLAQGTCVALLANQETQAQVVFAQSESLPFDLRPLMAECCRLLEGKGGGTRTFVQGGGKNLSQLQNALDHAESQILAKGGQLRS